MKIKFNRDTISKAEGDIKNKLKKVLSEPQLLSEVAEVAINDIKFQARRGVSSKNGQRFKPLSKEWIEKRDRISQATDTHPAYSKNRSNITITGQLLDALRKSITGSKITLFFAGFHYPYKIKYLEWFVRKKKKRRINLGKTVKGFQTSAGGISYVNTGNSGTYSVGKRISNDKLSGYVNEIRPFFYLRESLLPRLKSVVIRYIRRKL
jgi:hypothetical protein